MAHSRYWAMGPTGCYVESDRIISSPFMRYVCCPFPVTRHKLIISTVCLMTDETHVTHVTSVDTPTARRLPPSHRIARNCQSPSPAPTLHWGRPVHPLGQIRVNNTLFCSELRPSAAPTGHIRCHSLLTMEEVHRPLLKAEPLAIFT